MTWPSLVLAPIAEVYTVTHTKESGRTVLGGCGRLCEVTVRFLCARACCRAGRCFFRRRQAFSVYGCTLGGGERIGEGLFLRDGFQNGDGEMVVDVMTPVRCVELKMSRNVKMDRNLCIMRLVKFDHCLYE